MILCDNIENSVRLHVPFFCFVAFENVIQVVKIDGRLRCKTRVFSYLILIVSMKQRLCTIFWGFFTILNVVMMRYIFHFLSGTRSMLNHNTAA